MEQYGNAYDSGLMTHLHEIQGIARKKSLASNPVVAED
jgi:hypothetical protein